MTIIQLVPNGVQITQLMCADDCILMAKASMQGARKLKGLTDAFCQTSGERVNYKKSDMFFGAEVDGRVRRRLPRIFKVRCGRRPIKYHL